MWFFITEACTTSRFPSANLTVIVILMYFDLIDNLNQDQSRRMIISKYISCYNVLDSKGIQRGK